MKGTTDERALILYASLYFHAFSAKAQREALEASQREAASKLGSLEGSLASAQHSREELLRQVSSLSDANKDLTEENRKLKERNAELEEEVTTLRGKLSTLEAKFAELDERAKKQAAELETNKQNNEDLTDRLDKAEGERDGLQVKLKSTQEKVQPPPSHPTSPYPPHRDCPRVLSPPFF
jgi:cortexillin 1/2